MTIGKVEKLPFSLTVSALGFFFLYYDPGDVLIYWLVLLSRGHWFLSVTGILTKLPIGAPWNVWNYILTISAPQDSPSLSLNTIRYLILIILALQPIRGKISPTRPLFIFKRLERGKR